MMLDSCSSAAREVRFFFELIRANCEFNVEAANACVHQSNILSASIIYESCDGEENIYYCKLL
jgi:hypothetical protein